MRVLGLGLLFLSLTFLWGCPSKNPSSPAAPTPTLTATLGSTATGTPSSTETSSPTGTQTPTETSSPTGTQTSTETPTLTPSPTGTSTSTWTGTPTQSSTLTPTSTSTATATQTPLCNYGSNTPVPTPSGGLGMNVGEMNCNFRNISAAGTAVTLGIHIQSIDPTPGLTPQIRMAVYFDAGGYPGARIGTSSTTPQPVTVGWNELDVSDAVLASPFDCWVCYKAETGGIYAGTRFSGGNYLNLGTGNFPSILPTPAATATPGPYNVSVGVMMCP